LQISAYLTGRYGGMRNFGKIFGTMASMFVLGSGLGPVMVGLLYDIAGDYSLLKLVDIPGALVCDLLLWKLGPYPDWNRSPLDQTVVKPGEPIRAAIPQP